MTRHMTELTSATLYRTSKDEEIKRKEEGKDDTRRRRFERSEGDIWEAEKRSQCRLMLLS